MEENQSPPTQPNPQPEQNPTTEQQESQAPQSLPLQSDTQPPKKPNKIIISIVVFIAITILINVPIPSYVSGNKANCLLIENCPKAGLSFGPSLVQRILKRSPSGQSTENSSTKTPTPPLSQTPQTENTQTANWKTYRNEDLGVEFRYPPNWSLVNDKVMPTSYVERCRNVGKEEKDFNGCLWLGSVEVAENPFSYYGSGSGILTTKSIDNFPQEKIGDQLFYNLNNTFEAVGDNYYFTLGPDQKYYQIVYWERYPADPYQSYAYDENLQRTIREILSTFKFIE